MLVNRYFSLICNVKFVFCFFFALGIKKSLYITYVVKINKNEKTHIQ